MKLVLRLGRGNRRPLYALVFFCAALVGGCQTETVVLSPALHARVVDGTTGKPLARVQVTLLSRDATATVTAYSDAFGLVDMRGLVGQDSVVARFTTDTPRAAVHALFQRPGYQPYTIDSVNGYGFFKRYTDVHLYPE
jgi:hypothetical protein